MLLLPCQIQDLPNGAHLPLILVGIPRLIVPVGQL
jgi:hypothetical protein